jgi:hypothetical protein
VKVSNSGHAYEQTWFYQVSVLLPLPENLVSGLCSLSAISKRVRMGELRFVTGMSAITLQGF